MSQKLRNKLQKPRSNKRRGNIFYNYSQRPQTYGIGSAVKLLQKDVVISANSGINMQYSTKELDIVNMALQYKYVKILEVAVVQDQINLPNEQDKLYGIIDWGTNSEGYANLEESDNAKIFKNIGRNQFIFRPPRILTNCYVKTASTTSETRQVFASGFNEIERLFGSSSYGYYFPFYYSFKNNTTVDRKIRIIIKLIFRGSKNTADSEVSKRISEVVNSERNIDELIAEKLNELKQLKLKKGIEYVEMGTQTDNIPEKKEEKKEEKKKKKKEEEKKIKVAKNKLSNDIIKAHFEDFDADFNEVRPIKDVGQDRSQLSTSRQVARALKKIGLSYSKLEELYNMALDDNDEYGQPSQQFREVLWDYFSDKEGMEIFNKLVEKGMDVLYEYEHLIDEKA